MASTDNDIGGLVRTAAGAGTQAERHRAFGALVGRFQDMAWGCAYGLLGDAALAEDAAQDAFLSAWHNLGQLRDPDAFPGWLKRIVVTRSTRLREQHRGTTIQPLALAASLAAPDGDLPDAVLLRTERAAQVRAAVWELPEQQRLAVILFYVGDYGRQEVADFLGISLVAVKKRLASARARLKERLLTTMQEDLQPLRPSHAGNFAARVLAFTKLFSGLVDEGLPLIAAFDRLIEQEADSDFRAVIAAIRADVADGWCLSHALRKHPPYFSERYIEIIREGELSGRLEVSLERLASRDV